MRALPAHDPTHPQGGQRSVATGKVAPQRVSPPSAAGTTRIPTPPTAPAAEPATTRMPAAPADQTTRLSTPSEPATTRTPRVDPGRTATPPRTSAPAKGASARGASANGSREIESWLGDLRGGSNSQPDAPRPPATARRQPPHPPAAEPPTTAIPTQRPSDSEPTEKIDTREGEKNPKRRGGGVSAADLLRREGRL
jgi:RND superfamily putative drug exporter